MPSADVLVVEDAPEYTTVVTTVLVNAGYTVRAVTNVADAMVAMDEATPDVVVLDLGLPDGDGLELCRAIRERCAAYVLVISSLSNEDDLLQGFRSGADDYLVKPFSTRELVARVDALLRRTRVEESPSPKRVVGSLVVDPRTREVYADGRRVDLTRIEFDLLDALTEDLSAVLSRRELLDRVWGTGWVGDDHLVDVHIANLRKKLDGVGAAHHLRTVRGVGYAVR